jgi:hypothetical protein
MHQQRRRSPHQAHCQQQEEYRWPPRLLEPLAWQMERRCLVVYQMLCINHANVWREKQPDSQPAIYPNKSRAADH